MVNYNVTDNEENPTAAVRNQQVEEGDWEGVKNRRKLARSYFSEPTHPTNHSIRCSSTILQHEYCTIITTFDFFEDIGLVASMKRKSDVAESSASAVKKAKAADELHEQVTILYAADDPVCKAEQGKWKRSPLGAFDPHKDTISTPTLSRPAIFVPFAFLAR